MRIAGYDTDALPALDESFFRPSSGVLTLDADGLLYCAANGKAKLSTAIRTAKTLIFEMQFLTQCADVRAHLTRRGNFKAGRHLLLGVKPYQGNRKGKAKPPLLEPLREALAQPGVFNEEEGVTVFLHEDVEADDAMMMDAYSIKDVKGWSPDKDLQIMPCPLYDKETGQWDKITSRYGYIKAASTPSGTFKVKGHGTAFFWAQMLMGDTADNVAGLLSLDGKLCGPKRAFDVLHSITSEDDAANLVLDGYRALNQNPLPEAAAMWLLRTPQDTAAGYLWSLGLTPQNRDFLGDCFNRKWKREVSNDEEE